MEIGCYITRNRDTFNELIDSLETLKLGYTIERQEGVNPRYVNVWVVTVVRDIAPANVPEPRKELY